MTDSTYTRRKSLTDPRTKLLIVFLTSVFVFGGAGGHLPLQLRVLSDTAMGGGGKRFKSFAVSKTLRLKIYKDVYF